MSGYQAGLQPSGTMVPTFQLAEMVAGTIVTKTALALPQTATQTLFTVSTDAILVVGMMGIVTTTIGATANNLSLGLAPTTGTPVTTGIGGPTAINSLAAGTQIAAPASVGAGGSSLTAPSIPSSGNPAVNTYHGSVDVTLSGFTLTSVLVNGVQVGTTNGTYTIPAHGTIAITYSVVGTWTWAGSVALEVGPSGAVSIPKYNGCVCPAGAITWTTSASTTGAITWYLIYFPIGQDTVVKGPKVT